MQLQLSKQKSMQSKSMQVIGQLGGSADISKIPPGGINKKDADFSNILLNTSTLDYSTLGDYSKLVDWQ